VRRVPGDTLDVRHMGLGIHGIGSTDARRHAAQALLTGLKYLPPEQRAERVERIAALAHARLPDDLMLTSDEVRGLAREGVTIGAHTVSHPILTRIDAVRARREIVDSGETLAAITGRTVSLFAYPNGKPGEDFAPEHVDMVRAAGYAAAVTTGRGVARKSTDVLQLPRFTPWDRRNFRFGARLVQNALGFS
jgi:peptidoglycan/xylan/chitin deacetylase (PgdA/CDA1 family)